MCCDVEALTLATKAGVSRSGVSERFAVVAGVLDASADGEPQLKPGFHHEVANQDLANALDASHSVGAQLPSQLRLWKCRHCVQMVLGTADRSA